MRLNDDILLIDAGNTRVKWNFCNSNFPGSGHFRTESFALTYENGKIPLQLSESLQRSGPIRYAFISNVAGDDIKCQLQSILSVGNDITIKFAQTEASCAGVQCGYPVVENLGVDRWMSLLAAAEHYLGQHVLCIANCGTATTIDFLSTEKQHLGGMISIGADLIRRQLGQNTANLDDVKYNGEIQLFSRDTINAINSGAKYSVAGMINAAVTDAQRQLNQEVQLLITGGASASIFPLFRKPSMQDKELVIKGLAIVARMNI